MKFHLPHPEAEFLLDTADTTISKKAALGLKGPQGGVYTFVINFVVVVAVLGIKHRAVLYHETMCQSLHMFLRRRRWLARREECLRRQVVLAP